MDVSVLLAANFGAMAVLLMAILRAKRSLKRRMAVMLKSRRKIDGRVLENVKRIDEVLWPQIEALFALYRLVGANDTLPPLRRWAMSPDLLLYIYRHIRSQKVRSIIECGSGASTIIMAYALRAANEGGRVYSLENHPNVAQTTRDELANRGLADFATIIDAPLTERSYPGFDHTFNWYSFPADALPDKVELLVVDGPAGKINKFARYPAFPELRSRLAPNAYILVDDAALAEERQLPRLWRMLYPDLGVRELALDKGALEMFFLDHRVQRFAPTLEAAA
jgi:hypothetical protein